MREREEARHRRDAFGRSRHLIDAGDILVAAGRVSNTAGIGLEKGGVEVDDRGYIRVNDRLETTAADIWAMGECAGGPRSTHVSVDDFRIVTMFGSEAGEVMAAVQMAMLAGAPYPTVRDAVITRLTFAEGLGSLLSNVAPRPVSRTSCEETAERMQ